MKELIDSEEQFLDYLKDSFKLRVHYFGTNAPKYPAFMVLKTGEVVPYDPNINKPIATTDYVRVVE